MPSPREHLNIAEDRLHCVGCLLDIGKKVICPEKERPIICRYAANWIDPEHMRPAEPPQDRRNDESPR